MDGPDRGGGAVKVDEALRFARAAAARKRAAGAVPELGPGGLELGAGGRPDLAQLREWALVDVDPALLYSTRRGGAPVTWLKRGLLRLLRQYTVELEAQQTRFNVAVVAYLESLEQHEAAEGSQSPEKSD
jgi:hypothetical protein